MLVLGQRALETLENIQATATRVQEATFQIPNNNNNNHNDNDNDNNNNKNGFWCGNVLENMSNKMYA